ncbi:MAG: hypothetical protein Q9M97_10030 [Candidatus Gracilibacteria bacterium]|nr:hypothetical protein [Candidatus Gracilibacteria bacterium]
MTNIQINFLGTEFESPVFNASGPACTTMEELEKLGKKGSLCNNDEKCNLGTKRMKPLNLDM